MNDYSVVSVQKVISTLTSFLGFLISVTRALTFLGFKGQAGFMSFLQKKKKRASVIIA